MRIFIGTLVFLTAIFCVLLFEGICFRMVEKYAFHRLESCWGSKSSEEFNKYLKLLPLNHFAKPPSESSEVEFSMFRAIEEDKYASKVMSFGRPQRDDYSNFVEDPDPHRKSFRIKDLNHIRGLKFPGLKRFPTDEEVAKGWAGRQRDQIEYAKALFVELKPTSMSSSDKSILEVRNEDFLLERGIACLALPVRDKDSLVSDLRLLKNTYPAVCQKIVCRANGSESEILLNSCSSNPFLVNMIIVDSPSGYSAIPKVESFPWFFCTLNNEDLKDTFLVDGLLDWVSAARDSSYIYPSRIGGLLRIRDNYSSKNLISFHIPLIMECISFFESLDEKKSRSYALKEISNAKSPSQKSQETTFGKEMPEEIDFSKISVLQSELPKLETTRTQAFDCKMVRAYREFHADNQSIVNAKNRELILKIGLDLEQEGEEAMLQIRKEDPLFYQFYQSLKIIEAQSQEFNE